MPNDIVPTDATGLPAKTSTAVNPKRGIRVKLLEHLGLTQRASSPKPKERAMLEAREQESFASYDSSDPIDVAVGVLRDISSQMRSRRHVLGGLTTLPAIVTGTAAAALPLPDDEMPVAASPTTFDPIAFIAEMRAAGITLIPRFYERDFSIEGGGDQGMPSAVLDVTTRWDKAIATQPDWINRVFRILMVEAEAQGADPALIALSREVMEMAARDQEALERCSALHDEHDDDEPVMPPSRDDEARGALLAVLAHYAATVFPKTDELGSAALRDASAAKKTILERHSTEVEAWESECTAFRRRTGIQAASDLCDQIHGKLEEATRRLTSMTPTTWAGLAAKARASMKLKECRTGDWDETGWIKALASAVVSEAATIDGSDGAAA